jgi:hypothetical protein
LATKNRRIPEIAIGQPAVESPRRVPDSQRGQPSFVLGGPYPITDFYVNPLWVFEAALDVASIWERVRVFKLTGCPSIFLGTVS